MATQILMPALSPTMTEGKLARWLKAVGDAVRPGDVIAEIETDKATMEVEAVDAGTLSEILVEEGTEEYIEANIECQAQAERLVLLANAGLSLPEAAAYDSGQRAEASRSARGM